MRQDLGDGLVLRRGRVEDREELATFNARIHADPGQPPDQAIAAWTRDLFHGHPTFRPDDFLIVEDTHSGAIVSSLNLISQTWSYGGVPFGVGRVELVGTDDAYRRRGLVRLQFEVLHEWSRERGELVQSITGIPWYYRQFGYEYALTLDSGRRAPAQLLPDPARGTSDGYRLRPATKEDVPFILRTDEHGRARYLVSAVRDAPLWLYQIAGMGEAPWRVMVLETAEGEAAGYVAHAPKLQGDTLAVRACELAPGVSWLEMKTPLLRFLRAAGAALAEQTEGVRFSRVSFLFEDAHPLYDLMPSTLTEQIDPYAWYLRVPDPPAFLTRIAPVLEARLAGSLAAGYTGEVRINCYRDGVRLRFERGKLAAAEPWPHPERHEATASFPDLVFLQLLFGHRSLAELLAIFPDCGARTDEGRALVNILFPKQPSFVWGIA